MLTRSSNNALSHPPQGRRTPDDFAAEMRAKKPAAEPGDMGCTDATHVDDAQIVRLAQEAARRLIAGTSWHDWAAVGRAIQVGRTEAMREAHANKPEGRRYAEALNGWLGRTGLDKVADKATRSRLLDLIDHIEEVEAWRKTLPTNKRLELNHPRTVFEHWKRSKTVPDPNKPRPPSPVAKLKECLIAAEEEVARLKEANGGNLFTSKTSAKDVVRILRETFATYKLADIRRLLKDEATS